MKALFPLFSVLALSSGPAFAATQREDAASILRVVIRQEADDLRSWSAGPVACARPAIEESTFDGLRLTQDQPTGPPSGSPVLVQEPVLVAVAFQYRRQPDDPDGRMAELEPDEKRELADAVAAIAAEHGRPPLVTKLRSAWLTPPFRLCNRKKFGLLRLSSPVIRGDLAFVSVEWDCVMCGHGIDYALRRRDEGWQIISQSVRWMG